MKSKSEYDATIFAVKRLVKDHETFNMLAFESVMGSESRMIGIPHHLCLTGRHPTLHH